MGRCGGRAGDRRRGRAVPSDPAADRGLERDEMAPAGRETQHEQRKPEARAAGSRRRRGAAFSGSLMFGMKSVARTIPRIPIGMLMKKIQRQSK